MKKYIHGSILLSLCLIPLAHAETQDSKNTAGLFEQPVSIQNAGLKTIEYDLTVEKNQQMIYQGTVFLKNSVATPIFLMSVENENISQQQSAQYGDTKTQDMDKTIEKKSIEENLLLKLTVHIGIDNKSLWSDFLFKQTSQEDNGSIKGSLNQLNNEKSLLLNMSPEKHTNQKEFIISHINQHETAFADKNYRIILKAKILK